MKDLVNLEEFKKFLGRANGLNDSDAQDDNSGCMFL